MSEEIIYQNDTAKEGVKIVVHVSQKLSQEEKLKIMQAASVFAATIRPVQKTKPSLTFRSVGLGF
ncbi:MAG: hypothetical protein MRY79_01820 [Alphaproteobacteria bacterium]|nr:hypothetical protein [Alphaproteobacteria bacterium]